MELKKFEISDSTLERKENLTSQHNDWQFPDTLRAESLIRPLEDEAFLSNHKIDRSYDDSTVQLKLLVGNALSANLHDQNNIPFDQEVVNSIKQQGWISDDYAHLWQRDLGGSATLTSRNILTFILQTPRDGRSFSSLSLVNRERHYCAGLYVADEKYSLTSVLGSQQYLNRHSRVPRDFAVLPFHILCNHVDETSGQVQDLSRQITATEKRIADGRISLEDNGDYKLLNRLNLEHVRLQRRSDFEIELAQNLKQYLDIYEKLWKAFWEGKTGYLEDMREKIGHQMRYAEQIRNDLETMPRRIDNQSKAMFNIIAQRDNKLTIQLTESSKRIAEESRLDNLLNLQLAKATARVAEETRRDGAAMKTIAILTLTFLPGTAVASFFSMNGMFNWSPSEGQPLVSPYLYVFFVVTVPLTGIIYGAWYWWIQRINRQFAREHNESELAKVEEQILSRMRTATNSWGVLEKNLSKER